MFFVCWYLSRLFIGFLYVGTFLVCLLVSYMLVSFSFRDEKIPLVSSSVFTIMSYNTRDCCMYRQCLTFQKFHILPTGYIYVLSVVIRRVR